MQAFSLVIHVSETPNAQGLLDEISRCMVGALHKKDIENNDKIFAEGAIDDVFQKGVFKMEWSEHTSRGMERIQEPMLELMVREIGFYCDTEGEINPYNLSQQKNPDEFAELDDDEEDQMVRDRTAKLRPNTKQAELDKFVEDVFNPTSKPAATFHK